MKAEKKTAQPAGIWVADVGNRKIYKRTDLNKKESEKLLHKLYPPRSYPYDKILHIGRIDVDAFPVLKECLEKREKFEFLDHRYVLPPQSAGFFEPNPEVEVWRTVEEFKTNDGVIYKDHNLVGFYVYDGKYFQHLVMDEGFDFINLIEEIPYAQYVREKAEAQRIESQKAKEKILADRRAAMLTALASLSDAQLDAILEKTEGLEQPQS